MSFGVHPLILAAAVGAFAALIAVIFACRARSGLVTGLMLLLALVLIVPAGFVFIALHPELIDGRFRTYKAFYSDIQVGMTREQVVAAMERRYPADGSRKRPKIISDTPTNLGFFMDPETSTEPNCEGIFLTFEGGLVSRIDYSAD